MEKKSNVEFLLAPSQSTNFIKSKTQSSVDLVFQSIYMNWDRIRIFWKEHDKVLSLWNALDSQTKTRFSLLHREKIFFLHSCTITKSEHDSFFLRTQRKKERKEISNLANFWIHPYTLTFQNSIQKRCCHP